MGDHITEDFKETHIPQQRWVEGIPFPRVLVAGPAFSQTSSTQPPAQAVGEAVGRHKEWVESLLHSSGAVLFRGFPIHTAQDFNEVVVAFGYEELPYVGGAAPRTKVVGRVFTSNESPPDQPIPFHHEMAQVLEYPAKLFFYCEVEPAIGGETPIVPSHLIYKRMAEKFPDFVKKLEETGLLYIRILGEDDDLSSPIGRGWHSTFLTKDKDEAEKRYIAEGGLTGERRRWVPRGGTSPPIDPDCEGFFYSYPIETSYKQRCFENWKAYNIKLLKKLRTEGVHALGAGAEVSDVARVIRKLKKNIISEADLDARKPKAASKMVVSELKEELEAQDLPTDGNRQALYQRVQKQRRIKRSRGQRLWVPPIQEEEEVDDEREKLISQLQANHANDHTEYWKKRFLYFTGELVEEDGQEVQLGESTGSTLSDVNHEMATEANQRTEDENTNEYEDEDEDEVGEDEEEALDGGDVEPIEPPKSLGLQLLNDGETPTVTPKQTPPNETMEIAKTDEEWYIGWPVEEKFKLLKSERRFDVSEMYTIEDAWGWTWEKERKAKVPETWTQEKEVDVAMKIMEKVIELGGTPTIGDCAMVLRAAIRAPLPPAMVSILRRAHVLGYVFGSPLYDEVITLCVDLGERDAAIAIVADLEAAGINVPDETLDKVLHEKPIDESNVPDETLDKVLHEKPIDESNMQRSDPTDEVQA